MEERRYTMCIKNITKAAIIALAIIIIAPKLTFAQQNIKIGYVDLQKVIMDSTEGKKAMAELDKIKKSRNDELKKMFEDIKKLEDQIKKGKGALDDAALAEKRNMYEVKSRTYVDMRAKYSEEYLKKKIELSKPIYLTLTSLVREIGKRDGYTVVFDY